MCAYLHGANWRLIRDVLHRIGAPTNALLSPARTCNLRAFNLKPGNAGVALHE
jgi:hypothetical protein